MFQLARRKPFQRESLCFIIAGSQEPSLSYCSWVTVGRELNAQSACSMLLVHAFRAQ